MKPHNRHCAPVSVRPPPRSASTGDRPVKGIRVDDPSRIGSAWDDALAEDGPVLIEFIAGHDFPRPSLQRFVNRVPEDSRDIEDRNDGFARQNAWS
jgi:hypothetical protein